MKFAGGRAQECGLALVSATWRARRAKSRSLGPDRQFGAVWGHAYRASAPAIFIHAQASPSRY